MSIGLLLALERAIVPMNYATKLGQGVPIRRCDLAGKKLGIIGLGHIGARVARHAKLGFNMNVNYFSRTRKTKLENELDIKFNSLEDVLKESDYITIHTPAHTTENLLTPNKLNLLKNNVLIINLSAPNIMDSDWIVNALESNRIRGAAFDGFYKSPPEIKSRFLAIDDTKLIVLPRAAWLTDDSYLRMADMALQSISAYQNSTEDVAYRVL